MSRKVAVIGSGNIGTDLVIKLTRVATNVELAVLVGIDPQEAGTVTIRSGRAHEGAPARVLSVEQE